jgi:hypothetical protein
MTSADAGFVTTPGFPEGLVFPAENVKAAFTLTLNEKQAALVSFPHVELYDQSPDHCM